MQRGRLTLLVSLAFLLLHVRGEDDFKLEDALEPGRITTPASATKKPELGNFKDEDLFDGKLPPEKRASQGVIPGIISAVVVAVVGAVSSFIAYQKKKLCFKPGGDQENVNMESQQGAHAEPPVQQTLLQK
ncbi:CD99 antigen isoform 4-T4 [Macrochelys suwanniensis]